MRFSSANPLCLTLIISPAFSSSFRERLTVISHRKSSAANCLTGKYTNRIPFSSSSFFVSMASSIFLCATENRNRPDALDKFCYVMCSQLQISYEKLTEKERTDLKNIMKISDIYKDSPLGSRKRR